MPRDPGPPRGLLRTPSLGEGVREHERVAPRSDALAEHVAHFWWVRWELATPTVVETLPHPCVHVTVEARRAELGGVATGTFRRRLVHRGRVFGVKFRPAAFATWFARLVDVSPKWVIERYRLHEAAALLAQPAPPTLAEIAARLGYFDQAHFARAFKAVVGAAPSAYLAPRP